MELFNLNNFFKGWYIGNVEPTLFNTDDFEVAIKRYSKNDREEAHYHKIAIEYTLIIEGEVLMNNIKYIKNDIIEILPNESTDFVCLTDVITCVIKIPCVKKDKYIE
jgi:hypothetical protein